MSAPLDTDLNHLNPFEISGFRLGVVETLAPLGRYAVRLEVDYRNVDNQPQTYAA